MTKQKEFKLIVAGSRGFDDMDLMTSYLKSFINKSNHKVSIVSGCARGADQLAVIFAKANGIKLYEFPEESNRNKEMAEFADGLFAFWDGKSKGTKNIIDQMRTLRKPAQIAIYLSNKSGYNNPVM